MADSKITALTALTAADPANDMIPIVDVSDTPPASGNTKRISINNILACSPSATLASATISGDLTVDTSTLKVDSANNRVGIGTASPAETLHVSGGNIRMSINQFLYLYYGSATNYASLGADNSGNVQVFTGLSSPANRFQIANDGVSTWSNVGGVAGTAMTLNSTGLGVGASPGQKLDVVSSTGCVARIRGGSGSGQSAAFYVSNTAGTSTLAAFGDGANMIGGTVDSSAMVYAGASIPLVFYVNSAERMRIDSAGNLGVGVTPSAWTSSVRAVDIVSGGLGVFSGGITHNAYFDNTDARWEYKGTGPATYYNLQTGVHQWFVAASGTANNPITTFATAAMTLDASGNLILLSSNTPATLTTNGQLTVNATSNTNLRFSYRGSDGVTRVANLTLA